MQVGELFVRLFLDRDQFDRDMSVTEAAVKGLSDRLQQVGRNMSTMLTVPIMGAAALLLKGAVDAQNATNRLQAQLGITAEEAEALGETAREAWKNGFGQSIEEVNDAVRDVRLSMGALAGDELQAVTEAAMTLADLFQQDVKEVTTAAGVAMKNFGISGQEALDILTVGFQKGGDFSNELLDTFKEYSPQFAAMGMSADQAMGMLIAGAQAGAWNLDKVGDSLKEFNLRAQDGSDGTAEGFALIGLSAKEMGAAIAAGGQSAQSAFMTTVAGLAAMQDPMEQNLAGVALFGTQWEDVKSQVIIAMAEGTKGLEGFTGANAAAAKAAYENNPAIAITKAMRELQAAIGPAILPLANMITNYVVPAVKALADWFANLSPAGQMAVFAILGIAAAIGPVLMATGFLVGKLTAMAGAYRILTTAIAMYRSGVGLATIATWLFHGAMAANPIGLVIVAITALIGIVYTLYTAWVNNWGGIQTKTQAVAAAITAVINRMLVAISTGFNKLKRGVFNLLDGIMGALSPVVGLVGKIAPGFEQGFSRIQAAVKSNVADIDLTLQDLAISAEEASGKVKDAMAGVSDAFKPISAEASTGELQELEQELQSAAIAAEATGAAVEGMGEALDTAGGKASGAGDKSKAAAEDTRAAWERTADTLSTALQILQGEYDITAAKMGDNADEAGKLALKNAHLANQLETQQQIVAAVNRGYQESVTTKGVAAEETQKLQLRLVQEQKAQADLEKEIRSTNKAIEEQGRKLQDLTGKVEDAANKYRNDLTKALEDYQKKVATVNQKLIDDERRLTEQYNNEVARRASALMNWVGLFAAVPAQEAVTGQELLGNLGDQVAAFENWQALLADLAARGVDEGLIAELTAMGPQASAQLQALLGLTDDELSEYVLLWQQRSALATQQATSELAGLQAETQAQIAQLRADAAAQLAQYQQEWETRNREIRENTVKELETLVTEAERLGKAFADALTGAISAAMPGLGFAAPGGDQAAEAEDQAAGVIAAAQQQAQQQAAIVQAQTTGVIAAWQDAGRQLAAAQAEISNQTVTTWQDIQQRLDAIWAKMKADLVKSWAEKRAYIYDVLGQVDTRFEGTVNNATNWGSNLIGNLIGGIASRRGDLTDMLASIAQEISNFLGFSSPTKKGPGRTADQWMPNLISMMTGDLKGGIPSVRGAVSQIAAQMAKLAGIEPVVSTRMDAPEAPALPKLPAAPPVGYKVAAEIERNDTLTRDVETQTAAIEVATPEIDVPTITPDIELQAAEVEVITPKPVKPQVDVPKVNIPDAQAATPRATPAIDAPAISPIVEQPTITPIVPRLEDTATTADIEIRAAELEVSTGSLQDDLATMFKAAATIFAKSISTIRPPALPGVNGDELELAGLSLAKLTEGIEDEIAKLATVPQGFLAKLRAPAVNMETPAVTGTGKGEQGNTFHITVYGGWDEFERELSIRGIRI